MGVYAPSALKIAAPSGGFQQGGWYNGRQYWGGTLSEPGQIHPSSNQQGAGQAVSKEVNQQTSVAAGKAPDANQQYIDAEKAKAAANPAPQATPAPATGMGDAGGGTAGALGTGLPSVPGGGTFDLPSLYENLYKSSGISDLETDLSNKEKEFIETKGKINDNPFLSEATRVGRVAKLETLYNERTANQRNDIATKKADIETKLNIEMKQFDISSQAARDALARFNTLLGLGALDNASGEDIANITRSTGISSSAIYSAINANKAKNVETSIIQVDDGTSINAVVMNSKTGDVISSTKIGASKPSGGSSAGAKDAERNANAQNAAMNARDGYTLQEIVNTYGVAGGLSVDEIYKIYNGNSPRGIAKESLTQVKQGMYADKKGFVPEKAKTSL